MITALAAPDAAANGTPDWTSAQQKIALAHRGSGDMASALRHIEISRSTGRAQSPLQQVQLNTATAHILLSDAATPAEGMARLDQADRTAGQFNCGHQMRSIENIRQSFAEPSLTSAPSREHA